MPIVGPLLLVSVNVLMIMIGSSFVLWTRGMRSDRSLGSAGPMDIANVRGLADARADDADLDSASVSYTLEDGMSCAPSLGVSYAEDLRT